jgi:hypothetical protein
VGCETACWDAVLIRGLIWREFGGLSNRPDVCPVLHPWGVSFHQARWVSEHRNAATRLAWREQQWPTLVRAATRRKGLILLADAASGVQWGSLRSTWARRGRQPEGPTRGQRKGYPVFGAIASFSGRLFSQGSAGRFHAESSPAFFPMIWAHTTPHLFVIHAGAR